MRENIKTILMKRDQMTSEEADALISEAMEDLEDRLKDGDFESAYDICMDYFGLEPDYLEDMII
jgi:hypothetical protein